MRRHLLGVLSIHKTDNHIPKRQPNLAEVLKSPLAAIESRSNDNAAALKDTAHANSKSVRLRAALNMISQLALVVSNCKINKIICGGVKKEPTSGWRKWAEKVIYPTVYPLVRLRAKTGPWLFNNASKMPSLASKTPGCGDGSHSGVKICWRQAGSVARVGSGHLYRVHLTPCHDDVGGYERHDHRHPAHHSEGEVCGGAVAYAERA